MFKSYFNLALVIILCLLLVSTKLGSQTVEVILEPSISDDFSPELLNTKSKIFKFKGRGGEGIMNFEGELICGMSKGVEISMDGKYVYDYQKYLKDYSVYNIQGKRLDTIDYFKNLHPTWRHTHTYAMWPYNYLKSIEKLEKLTSTRCKKSMNGRHFEMDFINLEGDTVLRKLDRPLICLFDELIATRKSSNYKKLEFYDLAGKKLKEVIAGSLHDNKSNLFCVAEHRTKSYKVYDKEIKLVLETKGRVDLIDSSDLFIVINNFKESKNRSFDLYDSNGPILLESNCDRITTDNEGWVCIVRNDTIRYYNYKTKLSHIIQGEDAQMESRVKPRSYYKFPRLSSIKVNGLCGIFDYKKGRMFVEPIYKSAETRANYILCKQDIDESSVIYNRMDTVPVFIPENYWDSDSDYFVYQENSKYYLTDLEGNILYSEDKKIGLDYKRQNWLTIFQDDENKYDKVYLSISELIAGNVKYYDSVSCPSIKWNGDRYHTVKENGKHGIRSHDKIITDCVYERLRILKTNDDFESLYYSFRKDDKWGILKISNQ